MSFLAPLYVAGLAAISLPILLHLIRQMPRGRLPFSSLMFLTESPPRITRRSRIDNWLLLLLRAAAVALLALAFARPFLREAFSLTTTTPVARHVAILVDTSASMRRGDAWQQARGLVEEEVRQLDAGDRLSLFTFDRRIQSLHNADGSSESPSRVTVEAAGRLLEEVAPTWYAADLGGALVAVAERLVETRDRDASRIPLQIVLISDLAEGAALDGLQSFEWPQDVRVVVRIVRPRPSGNAGLQRIVERVEEDASDEVRVRVTNDLLAERDRFSLQWFSILGESLGSAVECYVPAGQSQVIRVQRPVTNLSAEEEGGDESPPPAAEAGHELRLLGDDHSYDNVVHFAPYYRRTARVGFIGPDAPEDPAGSLFFLKHALDDTARYAVELNVLAADASWSEQLASQAAVIVSGPVDESLLEPLRNYLEQGGVVLWSISRDESETGLQLLLEDRSFRVTESTVRNYLMLSDVDLRHPLFEPFRDPRYADFTTIRFWRARSISWDHDEPYTVLARFDDGSPALVQWRKGPGRCYLLASSWRPEDSQLALSTKFVPLLGSLLGEAGFRDEVERRGVVGQPLVFPLDDGDSDEEEPSPATESDGASETVSQDRADLVSSMVLPSGQEMTLDAEESRFLSTDEPGLYVWTRGDERRLFSVDVPVSESRTTPLDPSTLEQYGVSLGRQMDAQQRQDLERQMRDQELESRQQVWRWMLASALLLLVGETWLAGRVSRRRQVSPAEPPLES
jgi:hypothetical protein